MMMQSAGKMKGKGKGAPAPQWGGEDDWSEGWGDWDSVDPWVAMKGMKGMMMEMCGGMKGMKGMMKGKGGSGGGCGWDATGSGKGKGGKGGPEHMELVELVKQIQRDRANGGQEMWQAFCESRGGGKRDPVMRSPSELQDFLTEVQGGGAAVSTDDSKSHLVTQIKTGQRSSEEFKNAWWEHCRDYGGGSNDPSKHDADFLNAFLALAPAVDVPGMPEFDEVHQGLVQTIKAGQKSSEDYKTFWYTYCTDNGTQTFDPNKHPAAFLHGFVNGMEGGEAVAQVTPPAGKGWGAKGKSRYSPY